MLTEDECYAAFLEQQEKYLLEDAANALKEYICYENMEDDALEQKEFYLNYGFDYELAFEEDSQFYLLPKLVAMFKNRITSHVAETALWNDACQTLLAEIAAIQKKATESYMAAFAQIVASQEG